MLSYPCELWKLVLNNVYYLGKTYSINSRNYHSSKTDKHLLSIAPTRTGKGRGLILPNLLNLSDHSVFVIDPKGENALVSASYRKNQGHEIFIFNPYKIFADEFAERGFREFQGFNPLANLNPDSPSFTDDVAIIAEALIYDTGGDSHWTDAGRGLVAFLIMYLITEPTEKDQRTFRRLHTILAGGFNELKKVLNKAKGNSNPLVSESVGRYSGNNNEVNSIIATAETQTRIFKSNVICSALEGEPFNFRQMKNRKISVYLILPSKYLLTQARYLRMVLLVAMSQFMESEKGKHQVLVMLDEFANLGALNIIENGYGLIAGHGVTLWSFVQNLTQLQNLYPKNWETFIANSSVVTVSNVNDATTAEYFSRRAGQYERDKTTISNSRSQNDTGGWVTLSESYSSNTSSVWDDRLSVTEIYDSPSDILYLFYAGRARPKVCKKLQYDTDDPFCSRADKNPMHKEEMPLNIF
ncbi:type IV secretory system conjugative DNA transfer family protein [Methylovulum psychrotolerans]|uniref:Recombinase n=1 Tax=Methylovulum psychrotolerans TaxID=1704499 RepID=A0A2S5CFU2_9GAMM|nr:type IV secretory system conjugative DNA transfer family protein [Methylovulum psychrotolerans]POZ49671.1 recombinase [Methylovulum psychrotolerans]